MPANHFDSVKNCIKACSITECSRENIEALVLDHLAGQEELSGANMCDHNLTLSMLDAIMQAGGKINKDIWFPLHTLKERLAKKLLGTCHLSHAAASKATVADKLDAKSVPRDCREQCHALHGNGKWPATAHAKDSKALD